MYNRVGLLSNLTVVAFFFRPDHFQYAFRLAHEMQTDGMALNKHHYVELLLSCSTVSDIVAADRVFELATKT